MAIKRLEHFSSTSKVWAFLLLMAQAQDTVNHSTYFFYAFLKSLSALIKEHTQTIQGSHLFDDQALIKLSVMPQFFYFFLQFRYRNRLAKAFQPCPSQFFLLMFIFTQVR